MKNMQFGPYLWRNRQNCCTAQQWTCELCYGADTMFQLHTGRLSVQRFSPERDYVVRTRSSIRRRKSVCRLSVCNVRAPCLAD